MICCNRENGFLPRFQNCRHRRTFPAQDYDYDFLYQAGVVGVYGPGTVIAVAAQEILRKLSEA